jgi:hypothetical protein
MAERLKNIQKHLDALQKARNTARSEHQIVKTSQVQPTLLNDKEKVIAMRNNCLTLMRKDSLLTQVANFKKSSLGEANVSEVLRTHLDQLKKVFNEQLDPLFLPHLLKQLGLIETAKGNQEVDAAHRELRALLSIAIDEADTRIEKEGFKQIAEAQKALANENAQTNYKVYFKSIRKALDTMQLSNRQRVEDAQQGIQEEVREAKRHLETLSSWEAEHVKPISYINFSPVNMQWMQDVATNVVYKRVKKQMEGFIDLLRREETYRYGLLNHLFLIPYVQSMRKEAN